MRLGRTGFIGIVLLSGLFANTRVHGESWVVRVEEPTGLYPRTNEVVSVPYSRLGGNSEGWLVVDARGQELPWQATSEALLFPVSLIPGELPEYRVAKASRSDRKFATSLHLHKKGMSLLEIGNSYFRVVVNTEEGAILEAYNLTADKYRTLNFVETTPEDAKSLKDDIHASQAMGFKPVPGVPEENTGWTDGKTGRFTGVEILESGPLRGKVRLERAGGDWEFVWTADSRALLWTAPQGFRFTAVSAAPYLPFNRCVAGTEYTWPTGPDTEEPPDHDITPRSWQRLPGDHAVYYHDAENYGALGIVALNTNLVWHGVGSRKFVANTTGQGPSTMAITFPQWAGPNTVLEARREHRVLTQPALIQVRSSEATISVDKPAPRVTEAILETPVSPAKAFAADALSLDGEWELAWCEKGQGPPTNGWRKVKVPGSAHTQWLDPKLIYTPDATWVSAKEWWYRKSFDVPSRFEGKRLRLQFEATDYYADTWLNGERLGRHEGYMDPYEYAVSEKVRLGKANELLVRTWAPINYYWKHRSYTVKGSYGAVDQKPDDITALGITRHVRLAATESLTIKDVAVSTHLKDGDGADVEVEVELDGTADFEPELELTLSPRNFESAETYKVTLDVSGTKAKAVIPIKQARLWWTWDHGKPNLYNLDVHLRDKAAGRVIDGSRLSVGIREFEKIGWTFYLNRKRLFIRGTNYYYHLYMSEMSRAAYERDLRLMLQMNVNLIRLHCHFSNPEFYDMADELGVVVWQDFLEAWYPEDRRFSLRAAELYDPLIRSVRNHACIGMWATSDEESLENYRDLTKHLAPRPALLDPQRRGIIRSTGRFGDAHVYHGWYGGSLWEYAGMSEPFVSELGATSLPNYETLIKFMPNAWPIREHEDEWFFRRLQIPEAMHAWGPPGELSLKDYIPKTQAYVARLFQLALERSRRLKYNPAGGICHFHAIDIWPSVTMAAIDFERVPTKVFYTVQRSFAPVCASLEYDRDQFKAGESFRCGIWAINDRWTAVPGARIHWRIVDPQGQEKVSGDLAAAMEEDSVKKVGTAEWSVTGSGPHELRAEVRAENGDRLSENVFEFAVSE